MNTFVLIIVLVSHVNSGDQTSTITQEFSDIKNCQVVMKSVIEQTNEHRNVRVISRGCYHL